MPNATMQPVRSFRFSDALLAGFLIAITAMLLVPLPTLLLDLLLVVNLSFSIVLLLAGLYLPNALALLAFPSILLLTTLFRLSLNVASTRLILSQGDAGEVIRAFGDFLVSGEVIVGIVIFLILTVVNFIVIARGASRVSEVAARFALDALPGKQMAIDADLRAGLITSSEAQRRREDLRKESQLYGSMDGSMKFVQGDAIAGLFIIAVNIIGGMYLGVSGGMTVGEAVSTYTTLTVGDGLVHQIPAILISICAGMIVTRVSSIEGSSLGSDVHAQLFARPGTVIFAGALVACLGLIPGLPPVPFIVVGLVVCASGWWQMRFGRVSPRRDGNQETSIVITENPATHVRTRMLFGETKGSTRLMIPEEEPQEGARLLEIVINAGALDAQFRANQGRYREWWQELDRDFSQEFGFHLPVLRLLLDEAISLGTYRVLVNGTAVLEGELYPEASLVEVSPHAAAMFGLEVVAEVAHPVSGSSVVWGKVGDSERQVLTAGGIVSYDAVQYVALQAAMFFRAFPEEIVSVAEVMEIENGLEKKYPGLLSRTLDRNFLSPARLTEIFQELIREGEGIRDAKQVIEAIATYCSTEGASMAREGDFDLDDLVSFVRRVRRRHIVGKLLSPRRTLRVITLHETLVDVFEQAPAVEPYGVVAFSSEQSTHVKMALVSALAPLLRSGLGPAALVVRSDIRARVLAFLRRMSIALPVLTFEELEPTITVEPMAVASL